MPEYNNGGFGGKIDWGNSEIETNSQSGLASWDASGVAAILQGSQGELIYFGASGEVSKLSVGTAGQVLQTNGAGSNPSWSSKIIDAVDGITPTISGDYDSSTNEGNSTDGDDTTFSQVVVSSNSGTKTAYLTFDLGDTFWISQISYLLDVSHSANGTNDGTAQFGIEGSLTGSSWDTILADTNVTDQSTDNYATSKTDFYGKYRYIRVKYEVEGGTGNNPTLTAKLYQISVLKAK